MTITLVCIIGISILLLPYEVVSNKQCCQNIDKEESEDNHATPNLKESYEKGDANNPVYQRKQQEWNPEAKFCESTRAASSTKRYKLRYELLCIVDKSFAKTRQHMMHSLSENCNSIFFVKPHHFPDELLPASITGVPGNPSGSLANTSTEDG